MISDCHFGGQSKHQDIITCERFSFYTIFRGLNNLTTEQLLLFWPWWEFSNWLFFNLNLNGITFLAKKRALGADSIKRCHLTSIGNPIVEIRRSYDRLITTMGFPILIRCNLYIESVPCSMLFSLISVGRRDMYSTVPLTCIIVITVTS